MVFLMFTDDPTKMTVTWSTVSDPQASICEYGTAGLDMKVNGFRTTFVDGGDERRTQIIHRVTLTDLIPGSAYRTYRRDVLT